MSKTACRCQREGKNEYERSCCRNWIDYEEDENCCLITVEKHGNISMDEVSKRIGVTLQRIEQMEKEALRKIRDIIKEKNIIL